MGRNAALSFSELGYTVFALCPNQWEESGPRLTSGRSRDVASVRSLHPPFLGSDLSHQQKPRCPKLLYIWHNRKERSRSIPWGLVAPMQLNLWSRSQRETVHETVHAHCTTYDLHLVALVISPTSRQVRATSPPFENALHSTEHPDVAPEIHADEDTWRISVVNEVTEPVIMACDYKTLLSEASGRVIVLSNCAERQSSRLILPGQESYTSEIGSPLASLSLKCRTAAAENLAEMLESQGIRVCSIHFGPLAQCSTGLSPPSSSIHRYVKYSLDPMSF